MSAISTREGMFAQAGIELGAAYKALGDAADWLRSDWIPIGSSLTRAQAKARTTMFEEIAVAKAAINRAKDAADWAVES